MSAPDSPTDYPREGPPAGGVPAGSLEGPLVSHRNGARSDDRRKSRTSAVRAAIRMGRRDAWRNRGRSILIAVMVALPVLAASTVSVIYRSDERDPQDLVMATLGNQAQAHISYQSGRPVEQGPRGIEQDAEPDPAAPKLTTEGEVRSALQARISSRDRLITDLSLYAHRSLRFEGHRLFTEIREIDYLAEGLQGLIVQKSGRAGRAPNEVVISETLAREHSIETGDRIEFTPPWQAPTQQLAVVGVVNGPNLLKTNVVIGAPGTIFPAANVDYQGQNRFGAAKVQITWLVTGPDPVTWDQVRALSQIGDVVTSRSVVLNPPALDQRRYETDDMSPSSASTVGIAVVVIGLVLLQIALLAGPAIAVGARRNQRGLAIMASTGAEHRHLRAVVLASSGVIGLVASVVAAALGAALGSVIVLLLMRYGSNPILRVDLRPLDLAGLAAVGGLTAVAAALIPARQAARLDVLAALTGRRANLPPRLRVPLLGLSVTAIGVVLAYLFSGRQANFYSVAALALTEVGLILATGAVLSLVARAAVRLPFALRFALRDAARQRGRTVPAIAAVLAAIAGATCALVFLASEAGQEARQYTPQVPVGTTLIRMANDVEDPNPVAPDQVAAAVRRSLPVARLVEYRTLVGSAENTHISVEAIRPPHNECPPDKAVVRNESQQRALLADPRCSSGTPYGQWFSGPSNVFDDGSALPLLSGVNDATAVTALRAGRVVVGDPLLLWPDGTVHVLVRRTSETELSQEEPNPPMIAIPATSSPAAKKLTGPVFPLSAAKLLGVQLATEGFIATTTRMPTSDQEQAADLAVRDAGGGAVWVERGYQNTFKIGLLALVTAAALVGLGGTFTAVGLAAAESRSDVSTLAAVGADPGVRRRLAASQAVVIAGLGSVLGVASGLLAGWVLVRLKQPPSDFGFDPWSAGWRLVLPWAHLYAVGIGIPLLAVLVGYLTTRSRLPMVRRLGQ
jgi:putative ABC transport system permease protein